jgi:hypothetical protein
MSSYYRPRRRGPIPRSKGLDWRAWLFLGSMGTLGIGVFVWFIGSTLYVLYEAATTRLPRAYEAVADWGNDVVTTVSYHDWQLTDGVLYGGIMTILVLRYSSLFKTPE